MSYDIENLTFRPLHADEIELRVGIVSGKGASLLLYQDSRCAMSILDETVGKNNWQRCHKELKGNIYCSLGIWDEVKKEWVYKEDCGTESNTEKEKGEASDSLKRASVNWGIARELYTSPFIFVPCATKKRTTGKGYELEDPYMFNGAKVSEIEYDDKRRISALTIIDSEGAVMYRYPKGRKSSAPKKNPPKTEAPKEEVKPLEPLYKPYDNLTPADMITAEDAQRLKDALEATNSDVAKFLVYVGRVTKSPLESVDGMTYRQYDVALRAINEKINKTKGEQ